MTEDATHVIRDGASLDAWTRLLRTRLRPAALPAVRFELREIPPERNRSMSTLANGYRAACGCASSGLFMSVAVVSAIVSFFISGKPFSDLGPGDGLALAGVTVLAAAAGKLAGLAWARWRLLRIAAAMRAAIGGAGARAATEQP